MRPARRGDRGCHAARSRRRSRDHPPLARPARPEPRSPAATHRPGDTDGRSRGCFCRARTQRSDRPPRRRPDDRPPRHSRNPPPVAPSLPSWRSRSLCRDAARRTPTANAGISVRQSDFTDSPLERWTVTDEHGRKGVPASVVQTRMVMRKPAWLSGGAGIRTQGTLARPTTFKAAPFDRSGTPPDPLFNPISGLFAPLLSPQQHAQQHLGHGRRRGRRRERREGGRR